MFLSPCLLFSLPLLVSSAVNREVPPGASIRELGSIERDCQLKNNATREDLIAFHDVKHMKDTREAKCMAACILEKFGSVDEQEAPDVRHWQMYFGAQFKPEDQDIIMKLGMDCFTSAAREKDPDNCDFIFKFVQCFFDKIVEKREVSASLVEELISVERGCQQKNNATREDLIAFHDLSHMKETREAKCMAACILESYGSVDEQEAPDINHLGKYFSAQFKPEDLDLVMKIGMDTFTSAARENIPDNCDFVFKWVQTFIDKLAEEKIEIVKFFDV